MKVVKPNNYYHDLDRKTLATMREIPGFAQAVQNFMKFYNEKLIHGLNMSSKIRLGPGQFPDLYHLLPPICQVLGIVEPEFYLEMDPNPNAYTIGDTNVSITVTSGLIEGLEEDEIQAVLAHECGHIACKHCLYHSVADIILNQGGDLLGLGNYMLPLKLAFFHWQRCSEFSADRAAAIYMQGSDSVVETMIRLAGGNKTITAQINKELYLQQAKAYDAYQDSSLWDKTLQYSILMNRSHPFTAVRAFEIDQWCKAEVFVKIIAFMNQDTGSSCPNCGTTIDEAWQFCRKCGNEF